MATTANSDLIIRSSAFKPNELIPSKYTCDGLNINPDIEVDNIPETTKTLALIIEDPDAPSGTFYHWVIWNIPPTNNIKENSAPGTEGKNSAGKNTFTGPCPPTGSHHYHFKIFALDSELDLPHDTDAKKLLSAMQKHIISSGELIGLYKRSNS